MLTSKHRSSVFFGFLRFSDRQITRSPDHPIGGDTLLSFVKLQIIQSGTPVAGLLPSSPCPPIFPCSSLVVAFTFVIPSAAVICENLRLICLLSFRIKIPLRSSVSSEVSLYY
jgi:hypothetical protein